MMKVEQEGMPIRRESVKGDLYVTFEVEAPLWNQISAHASQLIQCLPPSKEAPPCITEDTEEVELSVPPSKPDLRRFYSPKEYQTNQHGYYNDDDPENEEPINSDEMDSDREDQRGGGCQHQ